MITLSVLNWGRPDNLKEIILPVMVRYRLIDEVIISHGRADTVFDFSSPYADVVCLDDTEEVNREFGIARRWLAWERARNKVVLSLDDDIILPESQLEILWKRYRENPRAIHGLADMQRAVPSFMSKRSGEQILQAGCYLTSADLGRVCLDRVQEYTEYIHEPQNSYPLWDGDYIFASLMSYFFNGVINHSHALTFRWLCVAYPGCNINHSAHRSVRQQNLFKKMVTDLAVPPHLVYGAKRIISPERSIWSDKKRHMGAWLMKVNKACHQAPSFLILGAGRCGTTALFEYLCRHKRITPPKTKELHILNCRCYGSLYEQYQYRSRFPYRFPWRYKKITGEATPNLLNSYGVAQQLALEYPDIRMIILLRDPIDRIWSMYNFRCHATSGTLPERHREDRTLEEALAQEWRLQEGGVSPEISSKFCVGHYLPDIAKEMPKHQAYLTPGLYARWIKKYFSVFPREQFLILESDALFNEPENSLTRIHDFLGLPQTGECKPEYFKCLHSASYRGEMSEGTREKLKAYYARPNEDLYNLLGVTYDWS